MHISVRDETQHVRSADIDETVDCVTLGASSECHVYLPDVRIADRHLRFEKSSPADWVLRIGEIPEDSPATFTRVYVNALEVKDGHELRHNDEIIIGRFTLKLFLEVATADAPRPAVLEEAARLRSHPIPPDSIVRTKPADELVIRGGATATLTQFAFDIHECVEFKSLIDRTLSEVMAAFEARRVWMGARRNDYGRLDYTGTLNVDGSTSGEPPNLETFEVHCADRGEYICIAHTKDDETETAMCVPMVTGRGILGMIYVDRKVGAERFGQLDLDLFTAMSDVAGRQIELLVEEQVKHQDSIAAGEQSFMRELQARMEPATVPAWETIQIAAYCKPGVEGAGDLYDMMRLPNGLAAFICGHVGGGATHAAMAMAETRAAFRIAGLHADPPHVVMRAVNWLIYDKQHPSALDCVGIVMNPKTGAMQYATAGAIGAVVVGPRGDVKPLTRPDVPPVGQAKDYAYKSESGRLMEGETIILFTPGCQKVCNTKGDSLGLERFLESAADCFGQAASTAMDELLSDLKAFFREGRAPDDITVIMIHRE